MEAVVGRDEWYVSSLINVTKFNAILCHALNKSNLMWRVDFYSNNALDTDYCSLVSVDPLLLNSGAHEKPSLPGDHSDLVSEHIESIQN